MRRWPLTQCAVIVATIAVVPPTPPPPTTPPTFQQVVLPFPVTDSTGRSLEAAFTGGFNVPRPQLVDADGDGDLDLFVQEVVGKIALFERDGERDGLPRFVFKTDHYGDIDAGQWYRFADVDRDGDLDLLTEQPFSYIKYYRNDGQQGAHRFVLAADTLRDAADEPIFADAQNIPQLGDLDCNDRADLLLGRGDGTVSRYETLTSRGNGVPLFELVAEEFEEIRIVGEGEIGGGDGPDGPVNAGPNAGGPVRDSSPPQPVPSPDPSLHGANTMALADIENKGHPDLFWGDFNEPGLLLIPNTGSCRSPNFRNPPVPFPRDNPIVTSGYNAPTFGDINGDEKLDLVFGVLGGAYNAPQTSVENLYYVEQQLTGGWVIRSRQLLPVIDVGSESKPAVTDLDGDGDLDLLLANKEDPGDLRTSKIYWLENIGSKTRPMLRLQSPLQLRSVQSVPDSTQFAPAFGDLDGDGRLDMVLGKFRTALAWYKYGDDGFNLVDSTLVRIPRGQIMAPTLGDLDGDGDLDLLVGESSGWLNYYRNDGTHRQPRFTLISETFDSLKIGERSLRSMPHLVDIDHDGALDLLVGYESDGLVLYRNRGTSTAPRFELDRTFVVPAPALAAPATGDFDGDGDVDIIVGGAGGGAIYLEHR